MLSNFLNSILSNAAVIISALCTAGIGALVNHVVTKKNIENNMPKEKLEIAYDRFYYPVNKIISEDKTYDIKSIMKRLEPYFVQNDKYIDPTTRRLLTYWKNSNSGSEREDLYKSLERNVAEICRYLRRKLGYLDPSVDMMYKTAEPNVKRGAKIWVVFCLMISFTNIATVFEEGTLHRNFFLYAGTFLLLIFLCQIVNLIVINIKYKIK